jgi:hypothetical protein
MGAGASTSKRRDSKVRNSNDQTYLAKPPEFARPQIDTVPSQFQKEQSVRENCITPNIKVYENENVERLRFDESSMKRGIILNEHCAEYDAEEQHELEEAEANVHFSHTEHEFMSQAAMSFGMDDQDLLFNLMYFNESPADLNIENIGSLIETANMETLAAHSPGNTPYKLRPASEKIKSSITGVSLDPTVLNVLDFECSICKDNMEINCPVIYLKKCKHCFHEECFFRWICLQGWCPVCRADIEENSCRTDDSLDES